MSTIGPAVGPAPLVGALAHVVLPVFAVALFLSATLLFAVQPMFTKMVLPLLGGSPSVWSVAMVFFQTVLLLGYAYAHALTLRVTPRMVAVVHLLVLAVAVASLPIGSATNLFGRPPSDGAALWLLALFAASIGLPFFAVAANAPMLQAWFAREADLAPLRSREGWGRRVADGSVRAWTDDYSDILSAVWRMMKTKL